MYILSSYLSTSYVYWSHLLVDYFGCSSLGKRQRFYIVNVICTSFPPLSKSVVVYFHTNTGGMRSPALMEFQRPCPAQLKDLLFSAFRRHIFPYVTLSTFWVSCFFFGVQTLDSPFFCVMFSILVLLHLQCSVIMFSVIQLRLFYAVFFWFMY